MALHKRKRFDNREYYACSMILEHLRNNHQVLLQLSNSENYEFIENSAFNGKL